MIFWFAQADLGQEEDFEKAKRKATELGATEVSKSCVRKSLIN